MADAIGCEVYFLIVTQMNHAIMKNITKTLSIIIIGLLSVVACKQPYDQDPVPNTTPSNFSANFLGVNASPDAPSLDLYVNNVMTGVSLPSGTAQQSYTSVPITSNNTFANTNIRAKA